MRRLLLTTTALLALSATSALAEVVPHPEGCPKRAFCGCGVSVRVFGKPVRDLFLARNWFRFPHSTPAAGRVAVRRGHVFYIEYMIDATTAMAYDPNSGQHKTRRAPRSIRGYRVVDPSGNRVTHIAHSARSRLGALE